MYTGKLKALILSTFLNYGNGLYKVFFYVLVHVSRTGINCMDGTNNPNHDCSHSSWYTIDRKSVV